MSRAGRQEAEQAVQRQRAGLRAAECGHRHEPRETARTRRAPPPARPGVSRRLAAPQEAWAESPEIPSRLRPRDSKRIDLCCVKPPSLWSLTPPAPGDDTALPRVSRVRDPGFWSPGSAHAGLRESTGAPAGGTRTAWESDGERTCPPCPPFQRPVMPHAWPPWPQRRLSRCDNGHRKRAVSMAFQS